MRPVMNRARRNLWALPRARAPSLGLFLHTPSLMSSLASRVADRSRTKPTLPSLITEVFTIALTVFRVLFFKKHLRCVIP